MLTLWFERRQNERPQPCLFVSSGFMATLQWTREQRPYAARYSVKPLSICAIVETAVVGAHGISGQTKSTNMLWQLPAEEKRCMLCCRRDIRGSIVGTQLFSSIARVTSAFIEPSTVSPLYSRQCAVRRGTISLSLSSIVPSRPLSRPLSRPAEGPRPRPSPPTRPGGRGGVPPPLSGRLKDTA